MKIKGSIDILYRDDIVEITVHDEDAVSIVCSVELSSAQFCEVALGRLARQKCEIDVPDSSRIGKIRESKNFEFEMPVLNYPSNRASVAKMIAAKKCPDGWTPSTYFGSRDSFFKKDGKEYARTTIYRWV